MALSPRQTRDSLGQSFRAPCNAAVKVVSPAGSRGTQGRDFYDCKTTLKAQVVTGDTRTGDLLLRARIDSMNLLKGINLIFHSIHLGGGVDGIITEWVAGIRQEFRDKANLSGIFRDGARVRYG